MYMYYQVISLSLKSNILSLIVQTALPLLSEVILECCSNMQCTVCQSSFEKLHLDSFSFLSSQMESISTSFERMELPALPFEELDVEEDNDAKPSGSGSPIDDSDHGFHDNEIDDDCTSVDLEVDSPEFKSVSLVSSVPPFPKSHSSHDTIASQISIAPKLSSNMDNSITWSTPEA